MKISTFKRMAAAERIRSIRDQIISGMIEIGEILWEGKRELAHGAFKSWIQKEVGMDIRRADEFMRLAEHASVAEDREAYIAGLRTIAGDSKSKILPALALPEHEIAGATTGTVMGQPVREIQQFTVRQLKLAIREYQKPARTSPDDTPAGPIALTAPEGSLEAVLDSQEAERGAREPLSPIEASFMRASTAVTTLAQEIQEYTDLFLIGEPLTVSPEAVREMVVAYGRAIDLQMSNIRTFAEEIT